MRTLCQVIVFVVYSLGLMALCLLIIPFLLPGILLFWIWDKIVEVAEAENEAKEKKDEKT